MKRPVRYAAVSKECGMGKPTNPPLFRAYQDQTGVLCDIRCEATLRDLFAAFALAGILGSEDLSDEGYWTDQIASRAYRTADAMLVELEKTK